MDNEQRSAPAGGPSPAAFAAGAVCLTAAAILSGFLVREHFGARLPGCGPQSDCGQLSATAWGRVPLLGWPVSFLGLAWFLALLAAWLPARGDLGRTGRRLVRIGCLGSVFFVVVMISLRKLCPYCAGVHAANILFTVILESSGRRARSLAGGASMKRPRRWAAAAAAIFVLATAVLGVVDAQVRKEVRAQAETERRASTEKILARSTQPPVEADRWGAAGFTGRYRTGPEQAKVRIVILTDYQCPDCGRIETELDGILTSRPDVSLSVKHFPMCAEAEPGVPCNRAVSQTIHPNACWAARAAEAAGILGGDTGFWKMHRWLFQRAGSFNDAQLDEGVRSLGFDPAAFKAVMHSPETLKRVQADIEDGIALGLYFTPMIFINGVEFKGWRSFGSLTRTVDEVEAKNPPPAGASADRPVLGTRKYIADWREQPQRALPPETRRHRMGAALADSGDVAGIIDIVVFGDYQEPYTASMDLALRDAAGRGRIRYAFCQYPINPPCNSALPSRLRPEVIHPEACRAALAAEAAGSLGGPAAFWKMHDWLMRNQKGFNDRTLRAAAGTLGLNADALLAAMNRQDLFTLLTADEQAAKSLGIQGVPMVFVDRREVPRPFRDEENIVLKIVQELETE